MSQDHLSAVRTVSAPQRVAADCWMVGHRNPSSLLQCNTYVRQFDAGGSPYRLCIDPGSQVDFPVVEQNIRMLTGGIETLDAFTLNHQDPDVVGNATAFCQANDRLQMFVTEETWRLTQHLRFRPNKIQFTNPLRSERTKLDGRFEWQPVPTPFCHFRGAVAFYDPEIRTLFTGDLFGGLNQLGRVHLFAEEEDWAGVALFQQIYMPSREILRYALRQIQSLVPAVEVIAPQHGHIIAGDMLPLFMERMNDLLVGHDLLIFEIDEKYLREYNLAVAEILAWTKDIMGESEVLARLTPARCDDGLEQLMKIVGRDVELLRQGYTSVVKIFARLAQGEEPEFVNSLRAQVISTCGQHRLPVPPIGLGIETAESSADMGG